MHGFMVVLAFVGTFAPLLMTLSYIKGSRVGHNRALAKKELADLSICSCRHPYSRHRKVDGVCRAETFYVDNIRMNKTATCSCVNYDGVPPAHLLFMKDV